MPFLEKSIAVDKSGSSVHSTGGSEVIFATFNPSGVSTVVGRSARCAMVIKDSGGFEPSLDLIASGVYQSSASANLSNLFYPFKTAVGSPYPDFLSDLSNPYPFSGVVGGKDLLPFYYNASDSSYVYDRYMATSGDCLTDMVSSDIYYHRLNEFRDTSNIRTIGLRLPMMGVGWGFDLNGNPTPSGSVPGTFKGGYYNGYMVDPKDYVAAPIDLRYDTSRNVWVSTSISGIGGGGSPLNAYTPYVTIINNFPITYGLGYSNNTNISTIIINGPANVVASGTNNSSNNTLFINMGTAGLAYLQQAGGNPGTISSGCTIYYNVYSDPHFANLLSSSGVPIFGRFIPGPWYPGGSGLWDYGANVLLFANETPGYLNCPIP